MSEKPESLDSLLKALEAAVVSIDKKKILYSLGENSSTRRSTLAAIESALNDTDSGVRGAAVDALAKIGKSDAVIPLRERLTVEPEHEIRALIIAALGVLHDYESSAKMIAFLGSDDPVTRAMAAWSLGELHARDALPELIARLQTERRPLARDRMEEAITRISLLKADEEA